MNKPFKFLAALVAAFTLYWAIHAKEFVGSGVRDGALFAPDRLTAHEMSASY